MTYSPRKGWRRLALTAAVGLMLGALAGIGECLHLVWFVRGTSLGLIVWLWAILVDGGIGLLAGIAAGVLWQAIAWWEARGAPGPAARFVRSVWSSKPSSLVTIVWRGAPNATASSRRSRISNAISRREALRLGVAAASATTLGLGALAWATKVQRQPAAPAALAYNAVSDGLQTSKPNILLVTLDTLRADQLGAYGNTTVKTPALDRLASQGARFDLHLIQEPQTNPSHGSMFTGMYPASSGIRVHMVDKLPNNLESLSTVFSAAGYNTAGLYSWMSFDQQYCGFDRGFRVYQNVAGDTTGILTNPALRELMAQYRVAEQYLIVPKLLSREAGVQQQMEWKDKGTADVTTDVAIAELQALNGEPFFMWLHYFDPHYPYVPPPPFDTQYDNNYTGPHTFGIDTIEAIDQGTLQPNADDVRRLVSLYQGEISFMDSHLARLFAALDQLGLTNNTIVAVTGDHGESFGEHTQLYEYNSDFFHPHDLFNAEQRTPLLLRYGGRIKPGTVVQAPSQAIDLFPTLLGLAGLPVPDQNQGQSLLPLLDGTDSGANRVAYGSMPDYVFTSVTMPGWKYIRNNASGGAQLYNLSSDPGEMHDVSGGNSGVFKDLSGKADAWMKAVKIA